MMLPNCEMVRDGLPEAVAGRLPPDDARVVAAHLGECADCRAEAELLERLLRHPLRAPPGLEARVRVEASRRRLWRLGRLPRPVLLAATVAAALLGGSLLLRSRARAPASVTPAAPTAVEATGTSPIDGRSLMQALPGTADAGPYSGAATLDDLSEQELQALLQELKS